MVCVLRRSWWHKRDYADDGPSSQSSSVPDRHAGKHKSSSLGGGTWRRCPACVSMTPGTRQWTDAHTLNQLPSVDEPSNAPCWHVQHASLQPMWHGAKVKAPRSAPGPGLQRPHAAATKGAAQTPATCDASPGTVLRGTLTLTTAGRHADNKSPSSSDAFCFLRAGARAAVEQPAATPPRDRDAKGLKSRHALPPHTHAHTRETRLQVYIYACEPAQTMTTGQNTDRGSANTSAHC